MKKTSLFCLALVLALGSLGVGYASWADTLAVSGTVETGELKWEFTDAHLYDEIPPTHPGGDHGVPPWLADYTCRDGFAGPPPFFWRLDKNVAWGTLDINDDLLEVTLHNVYPSYFNALAFYVRNTGTLPLRINHVIIHAGTTGTKVTLFDTHVPLDLNGDGVHDFEILWGNGFGAQIHPGRIGPEISFWMHVLQPAPQGSSLSFTIEIVAVQWNKYPYIPEIPANLGFETGDFTDWTVTLPPGASASVVSSHTGDQGTVYGPMEGSYFALVKTDGPDSFATVSQSFAMSAGMTLKGWAFFDYQDYHPFDDRASVQIYNSAGVLVATPWSVAGLTVPSHWDGPWTAWDWTAPAAGTYTVVLKIANMGDAVMDSRAGFDAHVVEP